MLERCSRTLTVIGSPDVQRCDYCQRGAHSMVGECLTCPFDMCILKYPSNAGSIIALQDIQSGN